jgi:hypothetical protein
VLSTEAAGGVVVVVVEVGLDMIIVVVFSSNYLFVVLLQQEAARKTSQTFPGVENYKMYYLLDPVSLNETALLAACSLYGRILY